MHFFASVKPEDDLKKEKKKKCLKDYFFMSSTDFKNYKIKFRSLSTKNV